MIVAHALTEATVDDAATAITLINAVDGGLTSVTGDAAYDTIAFYETAAARGATVVVPPTKTARVSRREPRSSARDRTIKKIRKIGRRWWKKEGSYHRQARVELPLGRTAAGQFRFMHQRHKTPWGRHFAPAPAKARTGD